MRIILVADHASIDFGGEAALPCHYFRVLLSRNIDVHLVVHERCKPFLDKGFKNAEGNIHYISDSALHRFLYYFRKKLPVRIGYLTLGFLLRTLTQMQQKSIVHRLINNSASTLIHQVIPVSPKAPSLMFNMGVPVVFGPLNGGMSYPSAFSHYEGRSSNWLNALGRSFSGLFNRLFPGKLRAAMIIVANQRTKDALPKGLTGDVRMIVENGVDLSIWNETPTTLDKTLPKFIYVGRLVDWKAVDILLNAFYQACEQFGKMELHIVGDGGERKKLDAIVNQHQGSNGDVIFHGWMQQTDIAPILSSAHALLLPSLYECGGAVVLEAMASSVAVISTNWGGPADYLDKSCGLLIDPDSQEALTQGFKDAIITLAKQPEKAQQMGIAGRKKIEEQYDWERKVDDIMNIYQELLQRQKN